MNHVDEDPHEHECIDIKEKYLAYQSVYFKYQEKVDEDDHKSFRQVRSIPASCAGWPHWDRLNGTEEFGDPRDSTQAWGIKFVSENEDGKCKKCCNWLLD